MSMIDTSSADALLEAFAAAGSTTLPLGPRDETWDAGKAEKSLNVDDYPKAHFWRDPDGDPTTKAAWKLPFAERDDDAGGGENELHAVWRGITAAAQRLSATKIPESDVAGVQKRIGAYYAKARKQYGDDSIMAPWEKQSAVLDGAEFFSAIVPLTDVDVRDPSQNPDNTWTFSGYAAVFNQQAVVFDSKWLQLRYEIDPHFFDEVFQTQRFDEPSGVVHFNLNHDMNFAVAATNVEAGAPGSLQLRADPNGLFYMAKVSRDDPDAVKLAVKMRDGVIAQASMAFLCAADETTETETEDGPDLVLRRLLSCKALFDVCATPQGVFSQTMSQLQTFAAGLGYSAFAESHPRHPAAGGGAIAVSPPAAAGGGVERRQELAAMKRAAAQLRR